MISHAPELFSVLVPPTPIEDTTFSVMAPPSLKPLPLTMAQILLPVPEMTGSFFVEVSEGIQSGLILVVNLSPYPMALKIFPE